MKIFLLLLILNCFNKLSIKNKNPSFIGIISYIKSDCNKNQIIYLIAKCKKEDKEFNLNLLDNEGQAAIHYAASSGKIDIIKELVKNGADINLQNALGETALILASERGFYEIISYLMSMKADSVIEDRYETNALIANLETGDCSLEILKTLIGTVELDQTFGEVRHTIAHLVCKKAKLDCLAFLISLKSKNPIQENIMNVKDSYGNTPFHLLIKSIENPSINEIATVIQTGKVDLKAKNNDLKTVQDIAVERDIEPLVSFFHSLGLDRYVVENITSNRLSKTIKEYGKIELDEIQKAAIQSILNILLIREEDFDQENLNFLKILAATLYTKWSKNNLQIVFPNVIQEDLDKIEKLDLDPLVNFMSNLSQNDFDEDLRSDIGKSFNNFKKSLKKISDSNDINSNVNKVCKMRLKKICSLFFKITKDKKLFIANTLIRQFKNCSMSVIAGLDESLRYIGVLEDDLEKGVHELLEEDRKTVLIEVIRKIYPIQDQQVHLDHQVTKDFENELKLNIKYSDPHNINYEYDNNIIKEEFYKIYTTERLVDLIKTNFSSKIYNYLNKLSGEKWIHLIEYNLFFNESFSVEDESIKGLLIYLGYLK